MEQKLETIRLDVNKGELIVNGKKINNVSAFSLIFKDGEYGLKITRDVFFESNTLRGRFLLDLYPGEINKK